MKPFYTSLQKSMRNVINTKLLKLHTT